jgi:mannose-6-phosphate isomerase-like protein (cupin superfamily)
VAFLAAKPPLHIHHREDEAWYVLDGKMTFSVDDAVLEATAGCFAWPPIVPVNRPGVSGPR